MFINRIWSKIWINNIYQASVLSFQNEKASLYVTNFRRRWINGPQNCTYILSRFFSKYKKASTFSSRFFELLHRFFLEHWRRQSYEPHVRYSLIRVSSERGDAEKPTDWWTRLTSDFRWALGLVAAASLSESRGADWSQRRSGRVCRRSAAVDNVRQIVVDCFERCSHSALLEQSINQNILKFKVFKCTK